MPREEAGLVLVEELDGCGNYGDVFELVKKAVKESLGHTRGGLMLYLTELPLEVGAFHQVGTNAIVMNRTLIEMLEKSGAGRREMNSFTFIILLHEYLHTLGYLEEGVVRPLSYQVAARVFGSDHPTARMAQNPMAFLYQIALPQERPTPGQTVEIIKDFDRSSQNYIV